ncbi:hypothetical protein FA15DRAFT_673505 [Coprinopsis marcescibilis]|uniref:Uncharacterized protein n=1 Tax=Coprinopsis marcescibilis TaxID=230819 RepID=A0A5C3KKI8_COPMA|nr:hypothetical protein FA15DRAFT_673505 [Coprinopsis marcescibilis]
MLVEYYHPQFSQNPFSTTFSYTRTQRHERKRRQNQRLFHLDFQTLRLDQRQRSGCTNRSHILLKSLAETCPRSGKTSRHHTCGSPSHKPTSPASPNSATPINTPTNFSSAGPEVFQTTQRFWDSSLPKHTHKSNSK